MTYRFNFRVWDKEFNQYWTDEGIKENAAWLLFPDNDNIENIEIEQCIGIKDKNGKPVFEGDILSDYDEFKFLVRWNALELKYVFIPISKNNSEDLDIYPNECELVGNIHENEELLRLKSKTF